MKDVLIKAEGISKSYKLREEDRVILDEISLSIRAGEMVTITGDSGSGKSNLLGILAGILSPDTGNVKYTLGGNETDVGGIRDEKMASLRRSFISYVPQSQDYIDSLTVEENIKIADFFSSKSRKDKESLENSRDEKVQDRLGIGELKDNYPRDLSGGEIRRMIIARALYTNPQIIIADEPSNDLDRKNREDIIKEFKNARDRGIAVVIVSHDELISNNSDIVYELSNGKLEKKEVAV